MSWVAPDIIVKAQSKEYVDAAQTVSHYTGLPLVSETGASGSDQSWALLVAANGLSLVRPDGVQVAVDFVNSATARRGAEAGFRKQPLARALGAHQWKTQGLEQPTVVDATAGLGRDAWMMAMLNCKVILVEQSKVLNALLGDAIQRALNDVASMQIASRLELVHANAIAFLQQCDVEVDFVYLDPMYPDDGKKGGKQTLVKKGMQFLHEIAGPDSNDHNLLNAALEKANRRVVVKRPRNAQMLAGSDEWNGQITKIESPNTRYDVYHIAP